MIVVDTEAATISTTSDRSQARLDFIARLQARLDSLAGRKGREAEKARTHLTAAIDEARNPTPPLVNREPELDALVAKHSGFKSMQELISKRDHYRPTLDVADPERRRIADAYDGVMIALGHNFRAERYESPSTIKMMKNLARRLARKTIQVKEG
jgi:hypothetical protein